MNDPFSTEAATPNTTEVVVTLKGGNGYAEPWVVLHAPDVASANSLLTDDAAATRDLLDATRKAADYFTGSSTAPAAPVAGTPAPPQASAPGGETRSCKHGAMKYQTGVAKSGPNIGSVWKRFVCPTPQGTADQCKAIYIND